MPNKNDWNRFDYPESTTEATRRIIIEIFRVLGAYSDRMVLIGGSVPPLLLPRAASEHIGTTDVDLALDHTAITDEEYREIEELLLAADYTKGEKPYVFLKTLKIGDSPVTVQVELLAGEYNGTGRKHKTQKVQGIRAMKMRGCDLAFAMHQDVKMEGTLPSGARDSATVRVPTMAAYLSMKGIALANRQKPKDAYDIYFCITNCEDLDVLVKDLRDRLGNTLVREGISSIADKFASDEHTGPEEVAAFDGTTDDEAKLAIRQDAFQQVSRLTERLGLK